MSRNHALFRKLLPHPVSTYKNFCSGFLRELLVQIEQLVVSQVLQVILRSTHSQIATFHVCESLFGWSTAA